MKYGILNKIKYIKNKGISIKKEIKNSIFSSYFVWRIIFLQG